MPRNTLIQIRKGTSAEWAAANPVLAQGEPGFETDTGVFKIGDGTSAWDVLDSISGSSLLNGKEISSDTLSDGDILVYRSAGDDWELEAKPVGGSNPAWGDITGTLSSQTDLQSALDGKADTGDVFSGSYTDLTDKPTIPTNTNQLTNGAGFITSYSVTEDDVTQHEAALTITESQISDLSHFSGSYNDLTNKPTIPTNNNQLTNGAGYITGYIVTEGDVTQYEAALTITESQISDLGSYLTSAPVDSVNTKTGAVVLDADDIDDTSTANKFTTAGDISKLAGIENGATADQSDAEIKTAYENNADTNAFTDAEQTKLSNIEANADVTDTANVTASGALMDSEVSSLSGIKTLTVPDSTTISTFGASLVDDVDASAARTTLGVDAAGTDNSTDVTLAGQDFLSLSGQEITANAINIDNLSATGTPSSSTFLRGDNTWATPAGSGGGSADLKPYCVTASSGGTITGSGGTALTCTLSTEQVSNANYSLSTNQITVTAAGTYQISYSMETVDVDNSGGARDQFQAWIEADSVEITQSRTGDYHREASGGGGISNSFICTLSASDVLTLRAQGTKPTPPNASQGLTQISILKVG